jgi:hypothetical protein
MRCWCARCKVLVPVVHLERWVTGASGEGIVRGACAICGLPTGEIGLYAAPAAQRRSVPASPERVRVAPQPAQTAARGTTRAAAGDIGALSSCDGRERLVGVTLSGSSMP